MQQIYKRKTSHFSLNVPQSTAGSLTLLDWDALVYEIQIPLLSIVFKTTTSIKKKKNHLHNYSFANICYI